MRMTSRTECASRHPTKPGQDYSTVPKSHPNKMHTKACTGHRAPFKLMLHPKHCRTPFRVQTSPKRTMCTYRLCPDKGHDRQKLTQSLKTSRQCNMRSTILSSNEANILVWTMEVNLAAVQSRCKY